jgi:hypothetical protein
VEGGNSAIGMRSTVFLADFQSPKDVVVDDRVIFLQNSFFCRKLEKIAETPAVRPTRFENLTKVAHGR